MHSYLGQKRLWRTLAVPWLSIEQFVLKGPFKPTVRNHVEDVICGLQLLNIDRERASNISENSRKLLATLPSGCAICIQESIIPQSTWLKDLRRSPRLAYNWAPLVVGTISWRLSTLRMTSRLASCFQGWSYTNKLPDRLSQVVLSWLWGHENFSFHNLPRINVMP